MRVTVVVLLGLLLAGCFPHNARHRKYAKLGEGAAIVTGIAMLSVVKTGADCTAGPRDRAGLDDCRTNATIVGNIGLGLILAGLVGFTVTTVSEESAPPPAPPVVAEDPEPRPIAPIAGLKPIRR